MASGDEAIRTAARKYFFENYTTRYADYDPDAFSNVAFIPAVKGGTRCLARPHEVRMSVGSAKTFTHRSTRRRYSLLRSGLPWASWSSIRH